MEKLASKYRGVIRAQNAFGRSIALYERKYSIAEIDEKEAFTASVIKHFEIFYGSLWKFLKLYLFEKYGTDLPGSKLLFRDCFDKKIITDTELTHLLEVVDIRNATTHVYDEEEARRLILIIMERADVMKKLTEAVKS